MVKTRMFEVAYRRGMTIAGIARVGQEQYSYQYLRAIAAGTKPVPRSSDFQQWAAAIFDMPVEELFWEEPDTEADAESA